MASSTQPDVEKSALIETVSSTLTLLSRFQTALLDPTTTTLSAAKEQPDPLCVLHDAAKLIKAHTTKISLLIINPPFTPNAIRKIIAEVANTCLPAMMSAAEICAPAVYGNEMKNEVKLRVRTCYKEFGGLLDEVVVKAEGRKKAAGVSTEQTKVDSNKDSLASTGVVWEACDSLMELKELGIAGLVIRKAQLYRDTLEDAIAELKEWGEQVEEDEGFEEGDLDSDEGISIENMAGFSRLPKNREDLRASLGASIKKLKLISTLYQALIKRRLKAMGSFMPSEPPPGSAGPSTIASKVDSVIAILRMIPDQTDDLASAFYDLDNEGVRTKVGEICESGKEVIELTRLDWSGSEDEFSGWCGKWIAAIAQM